MRMLRTGSRAGRRTACGSAVRFLAGKTCLGLSADKGNTCENPIHLEVWAYEGDGEFSLYEDSEGKTCVTIFKMTHTRGKQVLEIFTKGDPSFLPINRVITLLFQNIAGETVKLFCNGERIKTREQYEFCTAVSFDFDPAKSYKVEIEYREQTELERLKSHAKRILTETEGKNVVKEQLYRKFCFSGSIESFMEIIKDSEISETTRMRLAEILEKEN